MRNKLVLGALALGVVSLAACASSGAPGAAATPAASTAPLTEPGWSNCGSGGIDTVFASVAPVYRKCEVDRPALAIDTTFVPRGLHSPAQSCLSAVVEFVVDKNGIPLRQPVKVVQTNSLDFARVLLHSISRWRYQPAMKNGHPVRQLVRIEAAARPGPVLGPPQNPASYANIGPTIC